MRALLAIGLALASVPKANADNVMDFVRVACIPETRFLDVEYAGILDNDMADQHDPSTLGKLRAAWSRNGFHEPGNLNLRCALPDSEYQIVASQRPKGGGMCGGAPDIIFSLLRNGVAMVDHVVFGNSCAGRNAITHVSIGDGRHARHPEVVEICFENANASLRQCRWFLPEESKFPETFPIRQEALEKYLPKPRG